MRATDQINGHLAAGRNSCDGRRRCVPAVDH